MPKSVYIKWNSLDSIDRKIIIAVCFDATAELARRNLRLDRKLFYDRWSYLKSFYLNLLDALPTRVIEDLKGYARRLTPILK